MKKQVLLFAAAGLFAAGVSAQVLPAQLFTPQGTIQGQTTNQQVGIGETTPDGALHIKSTFKTVLHLESFGQVIPSGQGNVFAFPTKAFVIEDQTGQYGTNGEVFAVLPDGKTRIGNIPFNVMMSENLAVRSAFGVYHNTGNRLRLNVNAAKAQVLWNSSTNNGHMEFKHESTGEVPLRLTADGKVGINTDNFLGNHSLYIEGTFIGEELFIKESGNWPDYVFTPLHKRLSLYELDAYINTHKRLPGMPSAAEVAETGIEMGETVRLLTEKVEEISLYLIELKQENDALNAEIEALKRGK